MTRSRDALDVMFLYNCSTLSPLWLPPHSTDRCGRKNFESHTYRGIVEQPGTGFTYWGSSNTFIDCCVTCCTLLGMNTNSVVFGVLNNTNTDSENSSLDILALHS